jgi:hypothetical protein
LALRADLVSHSPTIFNPLSVRDSWRPSVSLQNVDNMAENRPIGSPANSDLHILGEQRRRFACDRCRKQKSKCLEEDVSFGSCERCLKAKSTCTHSPRSRVGRPPQASKQEVRRGTEAGGEGGAYSAASNARKRDRRHQISTPETGPTVEYWRNPAETQYRQWAESADIYLDSERPSPSALANFCTFTDGRSGNHDTHNSILWPEIGNLQVHNPPTDTVGNFHMSRTADIIDPLTGNLTHTEHLTAVTPASSGALRSAGLGYFADTDFFDVGPSRPDFADASGPTPPGTAAQFTPSNHIFVPTPGIRDMEMDASMDLQRAFPGTGATNGFQGQRGEASATHPRFHMDPTENAMYQLHDPSLSLF